MTEAFDLAYKTTGTGRPFLWGHGLMMSRAEEDRRGPIRWPIERLDDVELVRWDARGHGDSPPVAHAEQAQWPSLANDALALADHLGHEQFVIGGASMGAATAMSVACVAPERVKALVVAIPPNAWDRRVGSSILYRGLSALSSLPLPGLGDQNRASVFHGAAHSDLPWPDDLRSISCPVTILTWRFDPIHPVSIARRLHELLPQSTLHINDRLGDATGWVTEIKTLLDQAG